MKKAWNTLNVIFGNGPQRSIVKMQFLRQKLNSIARFFVLLNSLSNFFGRQTCFLHWEWIVRRALSNLCIFIKVYKVDKLSLNIIFYI